MRVLVIEDNRDFAQLLSDILVIQGCSTQVAYDALSAYEAVKKEAFDVVFSDINLSGAIDGLGFAKMLRSNASLASTPLVAISGYVGDEDKQRAIDAGFDLIFPKPVKFADLTMALSRFSAVTRNS